MGFRLTGRYRAGDLANLIRALPEGVTEFMCHPGHYGEDLRVAGTRLKESREMALRANCAGSSCRLLADAGVTLTNYRGLDRGYRWRSWFVLAAVCVGPWPPLPLVVLCSRRDYRDWIKYLTKNVRLYPPCSSAPAAVEPVL